MYIMFRGLMAMLYYTVDVFGMILKNALVLGVL